MAGQGGCQGGNCPLLGGGGGSDHGFLGHKHSRGGGREVSVLSPAPLESLQQPPNSLASKTPLTHTEVFPLNYSCRSAKLDENLQRREAAPCKPSSPTAVAVPAPAESPARARRDSLRPTPDLLLSARGAWSQSGSLISESAGTPSRVEGARPSSSGSLGYGRGDKTAPPGPNHRQCLQESLETLKV